MDYLFIGFAFLPSLPSNAPNQFEVLDKSSHHIADITIKSFSCGKAEPSIIYEPGEITTRLSVDVICSAQTSSAPGGVVSFSTSLQDIQVQGTAVLTRSTNNKKEAARLLSIVDAGLPGFGLVTLIA